MLYYLIIQHLLYHSGDLITWGGCWIGGWSDVSTTCSTHVIPPWSSSNENTSWYSSAQTINFSNIWSGSVTKRDVNLRCHCVSLKFFLVYFSPSKHLLEAPQHLHQYLNSQSTSLLFQLPDTHYLWKDLDLLDDLTNTIFRTGINEYSSLRHTSQSSSFDSGDSPLFL